jgi:hypothetical protein
LSCEPSPVGWDLSVPTSCPNVPTVNCLNDAPFAQFAVIRSVPVRTCDYGSGGRGFESLPARDTQPPVRSPFEGRFRVWGRAHHSGVSPT